MEAAGAPSLNVQQFFTHSFTVRHTPHTPIRGRSWTSHGDDVELFVAGCRSGSTLRIGIKAEIESGVNDAGCVCLHYQIKDNDYMKRKSKLNYSFDGYHLN